MIPPYYLAGMTGGMHRTHTSQKYFLTTCQDEIHKRITTIDWIELVKAFKRVSMRDIDFQKSQVLIAKLNQTDDIVVKMGDAHLDHEYEMGVRLRKIKGFVKYYCFFTCNDNFRNYFTTETGPFCKGKESSTTQEMQVILMPYFPLGSVKDYEWKHKNQFISCVKLSFLALYAAFIDGHIIHGDFHPMNIMLKETKQTTINYDGITIRLYGVRPWIMDYEASRVWNGNQPSPRNWVDFIYDLKSFLFRISMCRINISKATLVPIEKLLLNAETYRRLNREELCQALDGLDTLDDK
jgi:serine/threonine protein kinase